MIKVYEELATFIAEVDDEKTLSGVREALDSGVEPLLVVESLRCGMSTVGERFESKEYFLPDLILSADIFNQAIELVAPYLKSEKEKSRGSVVIGTVQGDIHDIGKNIVATMLRCAGFEVDDLGVDVAPEVFVARAKENGAGMIAMSGLLTTAFDAMKDTVQALADSGMRDSVRVIIGGGPVNETVLTYCGADACGKDPAEAVRIAEEFFGKKEDVL